MDLRLVGRRVHARVATCLCHFVVFAVLFAVEFVDGLHGWFVVVVWAFEEAYHVVEGVQDYSSGFSRLGFEGWVGGGWDGASGVLCRVVICCGC